MYAYHRKRKMETDRESMREIKKMRVREMKIIRERGRKCVCACVWERAREKYCLKMSEWKWGAKGVISFHLFVWKMVSSDFFFFSRNCRKEEKLESGKRPLPLVAYLQLSKGCASSSQFLWLRRTTKQITLKVVRLGSKLAKMGHIWLHGEKL